MPNVYDFDVITPESIKEEAKRTIREAMEAQGLTIDTREGSYTDILLSAGAYQVYKAYMLARSLMEQAVPGPEGGTALDAFGKTFGISRTEGVCAVMEVQFTGTSGTVIPKGTRIVTAGGLRYDTISAVTITSGSVQVSAQAENPGSIYNVASGTTLRLQTSLPNITEVVCNGATGGADAESDSALYERIVLTLSAPANSGNANSYRQWALECDGVRYAVPLPLWNGAGTVKVIIAGEGKQPVSTAIRSSVATYIEAMRPVGAAVTVVSVTSKAISVTAVVQLESGATTESVRTALIQELEAMFAETEIGAPEPIRYNRVLAKLLEIPGVRDYTSMTLNNGTANVTLSTNQVPKLGTITITAG